MRYLSLHLGRVLLHFFWWVFLICTIASVWLFATEHGTRWLIAKAIPLSKQDIQISGVHGTLIDKLSFDELEYTFPSGHIKAVNANADWRLKKLFQKNLWLDEIHVESLDISLSKMEKENASPETISIPEIKLPITINLRQLSIGKLSFTNDNKPSPPIINIKLQASFEHGTLKVSQGEIGYPPYQLKAEGFIDTSESNPLELTLSVQSSEQTGTSTAKIKGELNNYKIKLHSDLTFPETPSYDLNLEGKGSLNKLAVSSLDIETLEGVTNGSGEIQWLPSLTSSFNLNAKNINPKELAEEYPGSLDIGADILLTSSTLNTKLDIEGELRNYPLKLRGEFGSNNLHDKNKTLALNDVQFQLGDNQLLLSGQLSPSRAELLSFDLNAPILETLHPSLAGGIHAKGSFRGKWLSPTINTNIIANDIKWEQNSVQSLTLEMQPDLWAHKASQHTVDLKLSSLKLNQKTIDNVSINGVVSPTEQSLKLLAQAQKELRASGEITGTLKDNSSWEGSLSKLSFQVKDLPQYSQNTDANLNLSKQNQQLTPLCLSTPKGREAESVCVELNHQTQGSKLSGSFDITNLPVSRFSPWWSEAQAIKGVVNHHSQIIGDTQKWQTSSTTTLDDKNHAKSIINLNNGSLSGNITLDFTHLEWLALLTDQIAEPKGSIKAKLQISGKTNAPQLTGDLKLSDAALKVPATGGILSNGNIQLNFQAGEKATLAGTINLDKNPLTLSGKAGWKNFPKWESSINLKGNRLEAIKTKDIHLYATPDLTLSLTNKAATIVGSIVVPQAAITPGALPPEAVTLSSDENIMSTKGTITAQKGIPLIVDVNIKVGDGETDFLRQDADRHRVYFDGLGLKADLSGNVRVTQKPGKEPQGDGQLKVTNGHYQAYGQDLTIDRGEIYFNGPLANPGFSIEAVRQSDDIKAGIRLRGTVSNPESSLFSVPTLSDTDTLSYLLTGQAFDEHGKGDTDNKALLLDAASRFGLKSSGEFIQQVKGDTGLDTLQVQAGDDLTQSALLIGKYLTPQLYVQYAVKLFEETDIISLRYQLNKHLHLEAESGTSQGLDFIYQLEK